MAAILFPSDEWIKTLMDRLNSSATYAEVARNWEGDLTFRVENPDQSVTLLYLDLWHGKCREAFLVRPENNHPPASAFRLSAPLENFIKVMRGELDPVQAMITGKVKVQGNMVMLMKNIPTVLEFVQTCRGIQTEFVGLDVTSDT